MIPVLQNPFYYLDNFHRVLDWVGARYADLLTEEEADFLSRFPSLPQASRALFVRMVMRKGELFRASKMVYEEIGDSVVAAQPLLATGWIKADPELSIEELFGLLTKSELAALFALPAGRKAEQLEALCEDYPEPRRFSAWCGALPEQAWRIHAKPLCDRLRLIFFGNFYQDWTEFVLSELGIYKFESIDFPEEARGFRSRTDIDHYLALQNCRERLAQGEEVDAVLADLPPADESNPWLASRREKFLFNVAQQVEKSGDWKAAYALYAPCSYPGARARAVRVLEKDEQYQSAYTLLSAALAAPESEAERQQLLRSAPRLQRKLGIARAAAPAVPVVRMDLALPQPDGDWWVEGVVREHLHCEEAPVFYVENTLVNALFGLLCWRAIFMPIPGAFFHPFHRAPADLHSADFLQRRAQAFAECFAQLDGDAWRDTIRRNYADKFGIQCVFVAWDFLSEELLGLALECIPGAHLRRAFERIVADIKTNRSGLPDLVQFWPAEKRYRMIEVKGPGDRLQDNQLRWIDYCANHGMPVEVCYLQWA